MCGLVETQLGRPSSAPSLARGEGGKAVRAAKQHIADAETAARKAQTIAATAAQAFGEVAQQLNRAHTSLDGLV